MTTIAPLSQNLDLHDGEEFDLKAVAKNGVLVVTRIMRPLRKEKQTEQQLSQARRDAGFLAFAKGARVPVQHLSDEEINEGRLKYLMEKHVK